MALGERASRRQPDGRTPAPLTSPFILIRRRDCLGLGVAALTSTLCLARAPQVSTAAVVVHQPGLSASEPFATIWAAAGAQVVTVDDVGDLLYHHLAPHWTRPDLLLAGLTDVRSGFCIAAAAQQHGLRLVWQGTPDDQTDASALARQSLARAALPASWRARPAGWGDLAWMLVPRARLQPHSSFPSA